MAGRHKTMDAGLQERNLKSGSCASIFVELQVLLTTDYKAISARKDIIKLLKLYKTNTFFLLFVQKYQVKIFLYSCSMPTKLEIYPFSKPIISVILFLLFTC